MSKRVISVDAHPTDEAVLVRYASEDGTSETSQVIFLKDFSEIVDISSLSSIILEKCPSIQRSMRHELEQVLYYLQKRRRPSGSRVGSANSETENGAAASLNADINEIGSYIDFFYEDIPEKVKGANLILELSKQCSNLVHVVDDEPLMGALSRVFREDFRKSFELSNVLAQIFVKFSHFTQFHEVLVHQKIGGLCLNIVEYELKRGEVWLAESKSGDEKVARRCKNAIKKQHSVLASCITILTNLATDVNVELKMVRRDVVLVLIKCLQFSSQDVLTLAVVNFLLKLSIFEENKAAMENPAVLSKLMSLFPVENAELRRSLLLLLFNFSFDKKLRSKMIAGGLVAHIAPYIQQDQKALNLLYQLSLNDDAKAMITFTDAIQLLMRDLLSGSGSDVTKAVLLNACIEKRNAQLVCGSGGQGLDLLLESALESKDLLVLKIVRTIASHDGPTQELFNKWMDKLLDIGMTEAVEAAEERAALGLECFATAALIRTASWSTLCKEHNLVEWMAEQLRFSQADKHPLQLQIVIMCGTMARQTEAARLIAPLHDPFFNALHSLQTDDEFVVQLLYTFLQLLRRKELSDKLMGPQSILGDYVIDLMHDKNPAIREMCERALLIIAEHSQDWARRIAAERFRWHNEQWLAMIEGGGDFADIQMNDDEDERMLFDDQFDDGFDASGDEEEERVF